MKEKQVTEELNSILSYMTDVLSKEFNNKELTLEFLIVSILDNKKSHAYTILDNFVMSENIDNLKEIYINYLKKNTINDIIEKKNVFSEELTKVFDEAEIEQNNLNSVLLGSEHIILAILNPINNHDNILNVFNNIGVDYNMVINKCYNENSKHHKLMKRNIKSNQLFQLTNNKTVTQQNNYISNYTVNINDLYRKGKLDSLIGRKKEVNQIIETLARRKKNNVILVGNGGCGKTQIVYGIAELIENGNVPEVIKGKEIIMLDIIALVSGTHFRGMFEERVNGLFNELKNSNKYILFIDDMQNVLKSSSKEKDTDISSMIGNILSEGDIRIIGTTTFKDYHNSIETNNSISRKLQKIIIEPSTKEESIEILKQNKKYYEEYHNVSYSLDVIKKIVELSERYITDKSLPDSAIDVMDLSGAHTSLIDRSPNKIQEDKKKLKSLEQEKEKNVECGDFIAVDELDKKINEIKKNISDFNRYYESHIAEFTIQISVDDVANAVSEMTSIPTQKLTTNKKSKLANIEDTLKQSIIGQDHAIDSICKIVKRNKVGLGNKNKTQGNVLLLGPSGTGKTLLAKKLAEEIFGSEKELVRIDMSEYSEKHSVAKLTGAAPGYIGYENGGQLTEAIKNKQHCVLLLDEIEKADQEVYNLFLQLFDEGRLTDSSGQIVNFKNVIVLMTSNIGAKQALEFGKSPSFVSNESEMKQSIIERQLKQTFSPEFINRIDQIVYFNSLSNDNLRNIVKLELQKFIKRLSELNYNLVYDEETVDYIYNLAVKEKEYGARPIIRLIQNNIEDVITELILHHDYENNYTFKTRIENGKLIIE